jgi:hypothetical protein
MVVGWNFLQLLAEARIHGCVIHGIRLQGSVTVDYPPHAYGTIEFVPHPGGTEVRYVPRDKAVSQTTPVC